MFTETQGQVLNCLKSTLMGTHADWQILFMADASAAPDPISQRKAGLGHPETGALILSLRDLPEEVGQAAPLSMFDGLAQ